MIEDLMVHQPDDPINYMITHLGQPDSKTCIIKRKLYF